MAAASDDPLGVRAFAGSVAGVGTIYYETRYFALP
jgi:hypothetical protein